MIEHLVWRGRYWLSRCLLSAALFILPRGRFRDELVTAIYALKWRVINEVAAHKANTNS